MFFVRYILMGLNGKYFVFATQLNYNLPFFDKENFAFTYRIMSEGLLNHFSVKKKKKPRGKVLPARRADNLDAIC
jgi:hypothetical protein